VALATHHQQVCIERAALRNQRVGNLVFFGDCTIFYRVDAVVAEVKHSVIPLQRVRFRLTLTLYDKDANLACLADKAETRRARADSRLPFHATTTFSNGTIAF
jgi:hypothetical protein